MLRKEKYYLKKYKMKRNIEVELKYEVLDKNQIRKFLENLNFVNEKRVVDIYLDTKEGNLFKKGLFIRMRNKQLLDFKFNLSDIKSIGNRKHEHCDELSFKVPLSEESVEKINKICQIFNLKEIDKPDLNEFKEKNNFINSVLIDKTSRKYKDEKFEFSYDIVKDIGTFIEIEYLTMKENNLNKIKEEMRLRLKGLNLKPITTGYNELYWRKKDFNLYLQGKYLLQEDLEKHNKIS